MKGSSGEAVWTTEKPNASVGLFELVHNYGFMTQIVMNITCSEFPKIFAKLTLDFAERYNRSFKSLEVYALPRILHFIKQKGSKTREHWYRAIVGDRISRTKSINI